MQFYKDAELRWGEVYVKSTDTRLALDAAMVVAIIRQLVLFLGIQFVFCVRYLTGRRAPYTIGWIPARPKPWYKIWNVTKWMGFRYADDYAACDVLFYFEDRTHGSIHEDILNSNKKILNGACTDISKARVEEAFERTFGYSLGVDPTTYSGKVVQKSQENAKHDGRIIECPIKRAEPGYSYQRFIENCYDGRVVEDIRVPVVGNTIPLVYLKRRPLAIRFDNDNTEATMVETIEALSQSEVDQLLAFAREMGLDFGGLDVLRCRKSGKIFVVDVNKTDMGPPIPLKTMDKFRALTRLGRAFVELVAEKGSLMAGIPFVREIKFDYGACDTLSPLIRRVICNNPGPFTYTGTGTYIIGKGEVAVIDPGPRNDEHLKALMAALDGETVTHILITHTHNDHSPLARELKAAMGAITYAFGPHGSGQDGSGAKVEEGGDADFVPDVFVKGGDIIEGAGWTMEAVFTPGHTSNHMCFALAEEEALFTGDHVMGWSTSVIVPPDGNMKAYFDSLEKLLARDDKVYWPTHGPAITEPKPFVEAFIHHRQARELQIEACLTEGMTRIPEMVEAMYRDVDARLHPAAARSVHAHLIHMIETGRAKADGDEWRLV